MTPVPIDWYERFFEGGWLKVAADSEERAEEEAAFVAEVLALEPGMRLLDVACGIGRHARALARRGIAVTGIDLSEASLDVGREAARRDGLDVDLLHLDMREIGFDSEFDAAINMWTSFGYLETQEEDQAVLDRIARALRPGGSFLIDTVNPFHIARKFDPEVVQELEDGTLVIQRLAYDLFTGRIDAEWVYLSPEGVRETRSFSHRAYTMPELSAMLERGGFEIAAAWGDFRGGTVGFDGRLILVGRKA